MNGLHKFWKSFTEDNLHLQKETGFSVNFATDIDLFFIDNNNATNQLKFKVKDKEGNFVIKDEKDKDYSYMDFKKAVYEFLLEIRKASEEKEEVIEKLNNLEEEQKEAEALAKDLEKEKAKSKKKK